MGLISDGSHVVGDEEIKGHTLALMAKLKPESPRVKQIADKNMQEAK